MHAVPRPVPEVTPRAEKDVEVVVCPDGPLLVRGADTVRDPQGTLHEVTRPVVAVCVCEKSQRLPWCDGTHKVIPKKRRGQETRASEPLA